MTVSDSSVVNGPAASATAKTSDAVADETSKSKQQPTKMTEKTESFTEDEKEDASFDHDQHEREVWEFMKAEAWHNSITEEGSVFGPTYEATRKQVVAMAVAHNHDVILEVGCGTGDIIGGLYTMEDGEAVPRLGLDINEEFLKFCRREYTNNGEAEESKENADKNNGLQFLTVDALKLMDWWNKDIQPKYNFKRPLVTCVNNTLNIMPAALRAGVVAQMLQVAGPEGNCLVTYWNGQFFSHAVLNYYAKNPQLCGPFDIKQDVDWERRSLVTPSNYSTLWQTPHEVQQLLRAYDVDVECMSDTLLTNGKDHINCDGLSIFVWFSQKSTSMAKDYYDSDDAQKFYNSVWGEETVHVGRYDLVENTDALSAAEKCAKAQEGHEVEFLKLIESKCLVSQPQLRVVDFGCGYGGLLRRIYKAGYVWHGIGIDISTKMCAQARRLNAEMLGPTSAVMTPANLEVRDESFLDVSVGKESVDLVISMDALLHVGPERQRRVIAEAARILRPGGWMIFSDIMQAEQVDAEQMQPIYDRIALSKMGTVSNYQKALEDHGFSKFEFSESSAQIPLHYETIRQVLLEKQESLGLSGEYATKMEAGLRVWRDSSPGNIEWGLIAAQKTHKASSPAY